MKRIHRQPQGRVPQVLPRRRRPVENSGFRVLRHGPLSVAHGVDGHGAFPVERDSPELSPVRSGDVTSRFEIYPENKETSEQDVIIIRFATRKNTPQENRYTPTAQACEFSSLRGFPSARFTPFPMLDVFRL